ncbi:gamma-glutamylcyclotransferase [Vibrio aquaticus]|uniref:Gamma-glutamylcyclotransferase n=1 Tax=Vibrio aquaticus TaxID=2496559 RepID=A0A3S0P5L3_9VIBR|nr:gamma-glutamylcyclotransferase family protein [Vibrio aquaticus]RTZ15243.1 gamma-glutamylcyclotransferase [Vibrio aquaticus]
MANYIFGYGSLMNSASRQLTGQTSPAIPAVAHGLKRYWGKVDDSYILSPLVVNKGEGLVNGVLLEVSEAGLKEFDVRERGYHRITIAINDIDSQFTLSPDDHIWVYVKDDLEPPCTFSPIMQTYVDTVLAGCLEISEQFAKQFIEHTVGWHFPMENDRHQPKYGNLAGVTPEHHGQIDALIAEARG